MVAMHVYDEQRRAVADRQEILAKAVDAHEVAVVVEVEGLVQVERHGEDLDVASRL